MRICNCCGQHPNSDMTDVRAAILPYVVGDSVDPGGRVLTLQTANGVHELRLSDQCNGCDAKKIRTALATVICAEIGE